MKHWIIGGFGAACLGIGGYVLVTKQNPPAAVNPPLPAVVAPPPAEPKPPALLAEVIDVGDIDHLLDPPARPVAGVPFDADPSVVRAVPVADPHPIRIPPAVD